MTTPYVQMDAKVQLLYMQLTQLDTNVFSPPIWEKRLVMANLPQHRSLPRAKPCISYTRIIGLNTDACRHFSCIGLNKQKGELGLECYGML